MEKEEELINEIKSQIGNLYNAYKEEAPSRLKSNGQKILSSIGELIPLIEDDEMKTTISIAAERLSHTIHKEVEIAIQSKRNTFGKNTAKIRDREFKNDLSRAYNQMCHDLTIFDSL